MTEVPAPLSICTPSSLIIQACELSGHRRREAGLTGESLDSRHAVS